MARPLRRLYPIRTMRRRRHRSWILSMTCATAALGVLGVFALLRRQGIAVESTPWIAGTLSAVFSGPGLLLGLYTLRGKPAWFVYASMPIVANALLLALPWLLWRR